MHVVRWVLMFLPVTGSACWFAKMGSNFPPGRKITLCVKYRFLSPIAVRCYLLLTIGPTRSKSYNRHLSFHTINSTMALCCVLCIWLHAKLKKTWK